MGARDADDAQVLWLEVPARPGPLRVLNPEKDRDELETALDEMLGEDDDRLLAVGAYAPESLEAGHAAVREVASLLEGRPVASREQAAYVDERTRALQTLVAALAERGGPTGVDPGDRSVDALVRARRELDAELGSTVDRAADLARRVQKRVRDG